MYLLLIMSGGATIGPQTSTWQESRCIYSRLRVTRNSQRVTDENRPIDRARITMSKQIDWEVWWTANLDATSFRNERAATRCQTIQGCVADRGLFLQKWTLATYLGQIWLWSAQTSWKQDVRAQYTSHIHTDVVSTAIKWLTSVSSPKKWKD